MTQTEYEALREDAIARYENMAEVCPAGTEFVFAVTRDVYRMLRFDRDNYGLEVVNRTGMYDMFYGQHVCIINENTPDSIFAPAVCSRAYYPGMRLDDVILIENNHLYSLRSIEPEVMYVDTGLTVSFDDRWVATAVHRTDNQTDMTTTIGIDLARAATAVDNAAMAINDTEMRFATATINWEEFMNATTGLGASEITFTIGDEYRDTLSRVIMQEPRKHCVSKSKEEELNPGDTKALDDFLESFMRNGA